MSKILTKGIVAAHRRLDPDAEAYLDLTGSSDWANVDAWFKGLKYSGVYDLITEMWSLRGIHNTGSVVYGMKGVANGDTYGTTTQDNDEIRLPGVGNSGISLVSSGFQSLPDSPGFSVVEVGRTFPGGGIGYGAGYGGGWQLCTVTNNGGPFPACAITTDFTDAAMVFPSSVIMNNRAFRMVSVTGQQTGHAIMNGVTNNAIAYHDYSTVPKSPTGSIFNSGTSADSPSDQARSFVLMAKTNVLSNYEPLIRTLYKSTIGQGLGLP